MGIAISLVSKTILLVSGAYLALKVRKIELSAFNESKSIVFAIYNCCVACCVLIPVNFALRNTESYLIMGLGISITVLVMLGSTFGYKVYIVLFNPEKNTEALFEAKGSKQNSKVPLTPVVENRVSAASNASANMDRKASTLSLAALRAHGRYPIDPQSLGPDPQLDWVHVKRFLSQMHSAIGHSDHHALINNFNNLYEHIQGKAEKDAVPNNV
eukprot:TRINITY_DN3121_c0_g2_i2.p1 TRINITY_DN3121_c0_g2~~TRINITY_DN3121_c0_g2_i2.p1  ORF type:complete len:214 (-),score=23.74 TRINITY_DN3121_c0_g2_i2:656-1297(-)